jgi:hypothetical protein
MAPPLPPLCTALRKRGPLRFAARSARVSSQCASQRDSQASQQHSSPGAITAARNASQGLAAAAVCNACMEGAHCRGSLAESRRLRELQMVLKRRRRHCEACMPKARHEHGLRAIAAARKALAAQTAAGNDPRRGAAVNRARGEAIAEAHQRNRSWAREHPGQRDEAWFKREITPKLDGFSLKEMARRRDSRSQPVRASARARRCRIRGIGTHCSRWSEHSRSPRMGLSGAATNNLTRRVVLGSWEQGT